MKPLMKSTLVLALALAAQAAFAQEPTRKSSPGLTHYVPINSCRAMDTRWYNTFPLWAGTTYVVETSQCFVPASAKAVQVSLTVTGTTGPGFVGAWGPGEWRGTSVLTFEREGQTISTNFPTMTTTSFFGASFNVIFGVSGAHMIVDVLGYYVEE